MPIPGSASPTLSSSPAATVHSSRQSSYRSLAIESLGIAGINLFLVGIAIASIGHLFPQAFLDKAKLTALESELQQTQARVNQLQANYQRDSDPQQFQRIVQEENNLIAPNQRRVVWLPPTAKDSSGHKSSAQTP
jgi:hypothetical protein